MVEELSYKQRGDYLFKDLSFQAMRKIKSRDTSKDGLAVSAFSTFYLEEKRLHQALQMGRYDNNDYL
jgi:hypothetical protein